MKNTLEILIKTLEKDERLVVDGELLKNKVIELANKMDTGLLRLIKSEKDLKKHFFVEVDDVLVFDKQKFFDFVNNKNFLADSFTKYKNTIGLSNGEKYFSEFNEVVLAWPYKDTVLEGGQSKEDAKRNEVFHNEILAPDQIDRLLDPKVFTNFKEYTNDGEQELKGDEDIDFDNKNLIIKGNNLIALHSFKRKFAGKVKLIYIDPPYNTGNDSFKYNDRFNHSTWLTFMKNRLDVARELLVEDGAIFISIDDHEQGYLKVLADELFGRENYIGNLVWKRRTSSAMSQNLFSLDHEYVSIYQKSDNFSFTGIPKTYDGYTNPNDDPRGPWKLDNLTVGMNSEQRPNQYYELVDPDTGNVFKANPNRVWAYIKPTMEKMIKEGRIYFPDDPSKRPMLRRFQSDLKIDVNPVSSWMESTSGDFEGMSAGLNTEATREMQDLFGDNVFNYSKPRSLINSIIQYATKDNDLIMDFFAGSGTTGHAVLAANQEDGGKRKFILVEQMDYVENVTTERILKVMQKKKDERSDSFIFLELDEFNNKYIERIKKATDEKELEKIWQDMQEKSFLSHKVDIKKIDDTKSDYEELEFEEKKKFLIETLDKNYLYIPYPEIDDEEFEVSEEDKKLNKKFYKD